MKANGGVEVVQCLQNRGQTTKTADLANEWLTPDTTLANHSHYGNTGFEVFKQKVQN